MRKRRSETTRKQWAETTRHRGWKMRGVRAEMMWRGAETERRAEMMPSRKYVQ